MHSLKKPFSEKITKTLLWRVYLKASFRKILNTKQLQKLRIFKTMQSFNNSFPVNSRKTLLWRLNIKTIVRNFLNTKRCTTIKHFLKQCRVFNNFLLRNLEKYCYREYI